MQKRILAIGIPNLPESINQFSWENALIENVNISDYDIVLINFSSLPNFKEFHPETSENHANYIGQRALEKMLLKQKILDALNANIQLFFFIDYDYRAFNAITKFSTFNAFDENGEMINVINSSFSSYFEKLKKWNLCFEISPEVELSYLNFDKEPLAQNKAKKLLGVKLHNFRMSAIVLDTNEENRIGIPGNIFILHTLNDELDKEIPKILKNVCEYSLEKEEPQWSKHIGFEKLNKINENIEKLKQSEIDIQISIRNEQRAYEKLNEYKKLLWATGHSLEDIIHLIFNQDLHFQISKPQQGEDDGIFEFNSTTYMVEIKSGETRSAKFDELSKLIARIHKLKENIPEQKVKGIFIMNHFANFPLSERRAPFSSQIKDHAKIEEIILLTSAEIYDIIIDYLHEKISRENAIKKILNKKI
jgi:hypothetical protein